MSELTEYRSGTIFPGVKYYSRFVKKLSPDAPELQETVERPVRKL